MIDLIRFSPSNLKEFFDGAMIEEELGLPGYGVLKKEPVSFVLEENMFITKDGLDEIIDVKDEDGDGKIDEDSEDALPLVFKAI